MKMHEAEGEKKRAASAQAKAWNEGLQQLKNANPKVKAGKPPKLGGVQPNGAGGANLACAAQHR